MSTITLVLNDAEQQAFHQLLDTVLRSAGLNALQTVSHFAGLLTSASVASAQVPTAPAVTAVPTVKPAQPAAQAVQHPASPVPAPAHPASQHPGIIEQIAEAITPHHTQPVTPAAPVNASHAAQTVRPGHAALAAAALQSARSKLRQQPHRQRRLRL